MILSSVLATLAMSPAMAAPISFPQGSQTIDKLAEVVRLSKRYGVVCGVILPQPINDPLKYTLSDAQVMKDVIGAEAGEVSLLTSASTDDKKPTKAKILAEIDRLAAMATPRDTFWFYFSGHGTQWNDDGKSYLLPYDFKPGVKESLISISDIRARLKQTCKARAVVVVLDSCHSGSDKSVPTSGGLENAFGALKGVNTVASSRVDQVSTELQLLKHGTFTFFFVRGMAGDAKGPGNVVTLASLKDYVIKNTKEMTKGHPKMPDGQEPVFMIDGDGGNVGVSLPNDAVLNQLPQPPSPGAATSMQALAPGVIVLVRPENGKYKANAAGVEKVINGILVKKNYPVVSSEQSGSFLSVLASGSPAQAGAQAGELNSRFLVRATLKLEESQYDVDGADFFRCEATIEAEVLTKDGKVLASFSTDGADGRPIAGTGTIKSAAIQRAIGSVNKKFEQLLVPELDRAVKPFLN